MPLSVHEFLRRRKRDILQAWEAEARRLPEAERLGRLALLDGLPEMLDRIADWMERGSGLPGEAVAGPCMAPAQGNVPLRQAIAEHRLLRSTLFRLFAEEDRSEQAQCDAVAMQQRILDLARLNFALDHCIDETVEGRESAHARELETVLDAVPALMLITRDSDAFHMGANHHASEMMDLPRGTNVSKSGPLAEWIKKYHCRPMRDGVEIPAAELPIQVAARTGKEVRDCELALVLGDGQTRYVLGNAAPLLDEKGNPRGAVGAFVDITERKMAEEALRDAARRREEFLAVLSHELRNPLAAVRNSLFILEQAAPGGEQARGALGVIDRQVSHLTRLVEDLLDVSRISRGKVQLQRARLDLADLVIRSAEDNRSVFVASGVQLVIDVPQEPLWVDGDSTRLTQVIGNLLRNAAKFTTHGGEVLLAVDVEVPGRMARIRVRDSGVGIEPALRERLFRPFEQAPSTIDRSHGGLGLGLALVKGLVELHAGTVEALSDGLGKGAEFVVRLPLELAPIAVNRALASPEVGPPLRVLVIEDNEDTASTLREVLRFMGHEAEVAHSGPQGLEMVRSSRPEAVLCDIGLPGMDGYDVACAIRADRSLPQPTLIALTGYALPDDMRRAREAGFERHLTKPLAPDELSRVLASVARARSAGAGSGVPDHQEEPGG
jgi:signal transduction histidine kinase/CheY-like chemotaxis protein